MKETFIKNCKKHGATEHALYGKVMRCKQCMVEHDKEKRHRTKQKLVEYKGGKCEICGYDKCLNALDFHHKNKDEKDFNLNSANFNKSYDMLLKEVDKCLLLCSNCHRELHYEENELRRERLIKCDDLNDNNHLKAYAQNQLVYEDILKDFNNGLYQQDMAEKYNVSLSTIKRFMSQHNLSRKKIGDISKQIIDICKEDARLSNLSKRLGYKPKAIKNYCIKNNLIEEINKIRKQQGLTSLTMKMPYK